MIEDTLDYRKRFLDITQSAVGKLAEVSVKKLIRSDCPDCTYDPVNKESTDPSCQTCGGAGQILDEKKAKIKAFVNYYNTSEEEQGPGVVGTNSCRVSVDSRTAFVYREFLQPNYRIYIDDDVYEIISRFSYGIDVKGIETFAYDKVIQPTSGVV